VSQGGSRNICCAGTKAQSRSDNSKCQTHVGPLRAKADLPEDSVFRPPSGLAKFARTSNNGASYDKNLRCAGSRRFAFQLWPAVPVGVTNMVSLNLPRWLRFVLLV